jgi:hypothetical protein
MFVRLGSLTLCSPHFAHTFAEQTAFSFNLSNLSGRKLEMQALPHSAHTTKHFSLIIKSDTNDREKVVQIFDKVATQWVFQEKGPAPSLETLSFRHFEAHISSKQKRRLKPFARVLRGLGLADFTIVQANESMMLGRHHPDQIPTFQTKTSTHIDGPWSNRDISASKLFQVERFHHWQQFIWDSHGSGSIYPFVNIVIDPHGKTGKSTFCALIDTTKRGIRLEFADDWPTMSQMMHSQLECTTDPKLVIIDIPESCRLYDVRPLSESIERLKEGSCVTWKRRGGDRVLLQHRFKPPMVWVLSRCISFPQNLNERLWKCWIIDTEMCMREYNDPFLLPPPRPMAVTGATTSTRTDIPPRPMAVTGATTSMRMDVPPTHQGQYRHLSGSERKRILIILDRITQTQQQHDSSTSLDGGDTP